MALKTHIALAHGQNAPPPPAQTPQKPQSEGAEYKTSRTRCRWCDLTYSTTYLRTHELLEHSEEKDAARAAAPAQGGECTCGECFDCQERWWNSPADDPND